MSASEVEVGKHDSCVKRVKNTWVSRDHFVSCLFSVVYFTFKPFPLSLPLLAGGISCENSLWWCTEKLGVCWKGSNPGAPPVTPLKCHVLANRLNANRKLCLFCKFFKDLLVRKKRLVVLFSHWLLHAYGIISISKLDKLEQDLPLLALVPAPALFYLMTAKYTEPSRILSEGGNGHWKEPVPTTLSQWSGWSNFSACHALETFVFKKKLFMCQTCGETPLGETV